MTPWFQIAPLVVLLIVVSVIVWRGLARKGDDTANQAKGGGGRLDYWR